ncbi:V-type ATP synthase subunit E family protein [Marinitoga sp. 1155]|uniref:V-type ATP synthase subunit E family protein n=1 Tax=Marinitoga sp. 1155 TaxID=1428448 RepID=UPI00064141F2|nr:V-type ATP synthase subunit E family protein [Marinitoga sp. 1155]KLO22267.1 hypothetical protein X274_08945 [Marinitoga sp. 1155]
MNDTELKLKNMLELLEKDYEVEYKSLKKQYDDEFEKLKKSFEEDIEKYSQRKLKEANDKAKHILKLAKSKAELRIKEEKLKLKNNLLKKVLDEIENKMLNLENERKKYFYQKLYFDAVKLVNDDYIILCNPGDVEIIKTFVSDCKIESDNEIKGGIILKSKNVSIKNTIESYIRENKNMIFRLVLEEVGDI